MDEIHDPSDMVDAELDDTMARVFRAMQKELENIAYELGARADRASNSADRCRSRLERPSLLRDIRVRMDHGESEADAIAAVARIKEAPEISVAYGWKEHLRTSARAQRWLRDREIMRLAWIGISNAEIAARMKLGRGTVARIIADRLDRAQTHGGLLSIAPCAGSRWTP
jgi:ATP/maltotriose-dependent transcriptional regulator MalT